MSQATKTIGAGFRALGGASMASFTLEFLSQSGHRHAGTTETIVVPYAEMGRDSRCAIKFEASETTVSRKHASISSDNGQYFISPLSQTNQTFVNGMPINGRTSLSNGSEIQLSSSGPRMRFLAVQTQTSGIGMTQRLQMFASQSLRPYKTAVTSLAILLVLITTGMGYFVWQGQEKIEILTAESALTKAEFEKQLAAQKVDKKAQQALASNLTKIEKQLKQTNAKLEKEAKANEKLRKQVVLDENVKKTLEEYEDDVYFISMTKLIYSQFGEIHVIENVGSGTGFLLNDGKFITALHVAEPWYFPDTRGDYILNALKTQGGLVEMTLVATSPSGKTMTFSSNDFHYNESALNKRKIDYDGEEYLVRINGNNTWGADWAWIQTQFKGKIVPDPELSVKMEDNDKVYVVGYTFGLSNQSAEELNPLHSTMTIAQNGLTKGVIKVSGRSFDSGNSGGPVFAMNKKGQLVNIGIVSHGQKVVGGIVPISNIR
ncbi:MAG: hypothetical protein B7C24_06675 [Bacteroidetes bacterium 4572_77]|nr:MAG: hypothetical protein B7C24_06675 [Bacteroidetes bacterium 4572_77]